MQEGGTCSTAQVDNYEQTTLENCAYVCSKDRRCSGFSFKTDTSECIIHDSIDSNLQPESNTNCYVPGQNF